MAMFDVPACWSGLMESESLAALASTPFLVRCQAGSISRHELLDFVVEHYFYSRHFTRYLGALLAALELEEDRHALASNLFEEMGLATAGGVPHAKMYREMMAALGVSPNERRPLPETEQLVSTMFECCRSPRPMVGLGALCLGAEAIVPTLYSTILNGFVAVGEPRERLGFFVTHVECDDGHAETMRRIMRRELEADSSSAIDLRYGAQHAIVARVAFFRGLGGASTGKSRAA